jgi:hypothetical protein
MTIACLAYFPALGVIFALGVRSLHLTAGAVLVSIFVLVWADLVLTAEVLSPFSAIGSFDAYVAASLAIAILISAGLRLVPLERELSVQEFPDPLPPKLSRSVIWFLGITATLALLIDLVMAFGLLPANPDSIVYRFPRAYWYLGHGALTHVSNVSDPRVLFYPFDGTLLYLPLIQFHLIPQAFTLVSLGCWLMIGLTTYLFARDLGGPKLFAAATAWLICLTPNVLLQSLSTNDEIIAASAMLAGLFFLHRWYRGRQTLDALIAIAGVAISAGAKLHVMFYWPLAIAIAAALAVHFRETLTELRSWLTPRRFTALVITIGLSSVMAFSFIVYNYASTGRTTAWEFNNQLLNTPFNWHAAWQTTVLYVSQIVLTPIADLHFVLNPPARAAHYESFNRLFAPLFVWVENGPAFSSASYRFTGINSASAVVFNEQTIFIGFTWLVALIAAVRLFFNRRESSTVWPKFHLASFAVWIFTFAASTRYIEGFSVYLGYAVIVAAPVLVFAFAPVRNKTLDRLRWVLLVFVVATHGFFALDIFLTSSPRNILALRHAPHWPVSRGFSIEDPVLREIAASKHGIVNRSIAWEQPFWATMFDHPEIPQYLASNPDPIPVPPGAPTDPVSLQLRYSRYIVMPRPGDQRLHLFLFPQAPRFGQTVAIRIPDKTSPGLTWIGDIGFALGPEWVFAAGNEVESRHVGRDKYVLVPYQEQPGGADGQGRLIRIPPIVYGLGEADSLQFRFELKVDGRAVAASDWQQVPSADLALPHDSGDKAVLTVFVRNDGASGAIYSTDVELHSTQPLLLAVAGK